MNDLRSLTTLPPRELDARLAVAMGVDPKTVWTIQGDPRRFETYQGAWMAHGCRPAGTPTPVEQKVYPTYSDPRAPRSLLESVEAEIERRGLELEYAQALMDMLETTRLVWRRLFRIASAPAKVRAAAAVAVMEPK